MNDITFAEWAEHAKNIHELFHGTNDEQWEFVVALCQEYGDSSVPWIRWGETDYESRVDRLATTFIAMRRENPKITIKEIVGILEVNA